MNPIREGIWPAMITPYLENGEIDEVACERIIEWYAGQGVRGVFACCQSSEMFFLSSEERVRLTKCVTRAARAFDMQVIASGHVASGLTTQIEDMKRMAETGAQALILVTNRLAAENEPDDVLKENAGRILDALPGVAFGLYECPYPYKRLLSPETFKWCVDTGRFLCMKDTTCDTAAIGEKLAAIRGADFRLFNANTATLLDTLRLGAAGLSGIMPNFHANLYVRLTEIFREKPRAAEALARRLTMMGMAGYQSYPLNAKYSLNLEGIPMALTTRFPGAKPLTFAMRAEIEQMRDFAKETSFDLACQ